jgi:hypothetical protein
MNKTILFPTDFTIESLNVVKTVLNDVNPNIKCDIILVHGIRMTDSITDLLFFSKSRFIDELSNEAFDDACEIIRNKFDSRINSIRTEVFSGYNQNAFNNFVEGNKVDEAYMPTNYNLKLVYRKSFDILPFIKNSNVVVNEIAWQAQQHIPGKGQLSEVFYSNVAMSS